MNKKRSVKKIILPVLVCLILALVAGWWAFSVSIYNDNFNKRFESYEPYLLYPEDYEGLSCTEYTFTSDKGQHLQGYLYSAGEDQRGIIVLAHGLGAGHNSYMDCADFFAQNGYYVFAYDATGNDKSEGEGVGGIPQGAIDLDHAITFVEESGEFPDLPVMLFGHSWGGYSVCSVLTYHPEVKAVIECAGCNRSSDLFEAGGKQQAGNVIYTMLPFVRIHERIRYGKYASNTAMDGFAASDAAVMAVHSEDDSVVPIEYGFDKYYAAYKDDPRFTFIRLTDKGHNYLFNDQSYIDEFNAAFDQWLTTLDYDYQAQENSERFKADKADYIRTHLDRSRWCHMLDTALFAQFLAFYDAHVG
ncbi:MAG: alpha/beta fold hydrolase [Oscillospiraceae bacterium]|nr:alpha/beta fold hydrolase [Oscillospiraceae bacterium]